ncbi:MAG: hypothetical protein AAFA34_04340, partial [Thermoplasmata archaeon]
MGGVLSKHTDPTGDLDSPFGKVRGMVFPRMVLAGHGVLNELASTCRQFDFPKKGAVVTGPRTATLAGRRAAELLEAEGFEAPLLTVGEATPEEVDRTRAEVESRG